MKRFLLLLCVISASGLGHAQDDPVTVVNMIPAPVSATSPSSASTSEAALPLATGGLQAPPPIVPAGRWEGDFNASLTATYGNSSGQSLSLSSDTSYQRPDDKLALSAQYLESRARSVSNGVATTNLTASQWRLGGRYDRDLNPLDFGFIGLEFSRDQIRQLLFRTVASAGLGRHLVKSSDHQWDVFAGLSYREDIYDPPGVLIDGVFQARYDAIETLLGQESSYKLSETARLKQKLVLYPGLGNSKGTRAALDAGLQVDLNKTLSLTVKLQGRYDGLAEPPAEKYDVLFMTGLSIRFGG